MKGARLILPWLQYSSCGGLDSKDVCVSGFICLPDGARFATCKILSKVNEAGRALVWAIASLVLTGASIAPPTIPTFSRFARFPATENLCRQSLSSLLEGHRPATKELADRRMRVKSDVGGTGVWVRSISCVLPDVRDRNAAPPQLPKGFVARSRNSSDRSGRSETHDSTAIANGTTNRSISGARYLAGLKPVCHRTQTMHLDMGI